MITDAERDRIRKHATAEAGNAPPPTGSQMAGLSTLLGPVTAEAAAARTQEDAAARGAA